MTELSIEDIPRSEPTALPRISGWECSAHPPASIQQPDQLQAHGIEWFSVASPGTVASALAAAGRWDFEHPVDIDAFDWCFRTTFTASEPVAAPCRLRFEGLATQAEVWLNGQPLLAVDNMFRTYIVDVTGRLLVENELVCVFRSLKHELKRRRARPRWKTNLVANQQMRWHRTSLLGRIPGWAPCAPIVGPWREVRLDMSPVQIDDLALRTHVEGNVGVITVRARLTAEEPIEAAWLRLAGIDHALSVGHDEDGQRIEAEIRVDNPALWWPHTHGTPALYDCAIVVETASSRVELAQHKVSFRTFEVDRSTGFAVKVNGVPVFCRGACWTIADLLNPSTSLEHDLRLARDAGANMLRVGGTMTYESEAFYRLCDELGMLVWQDFMFANMDYPVDDAEFRENITQEATEQMQRLAKHSCVAIYCGNSEIEQQAAMLGMPRENWTNPWFAEDLPRLCAAIHPGTCYLPSTPTGGVLPFHTNQGVTHYYGVGAYLRSAGELRKADVKFTSECLAFANVPEPATCFEISGGALPVTHHPRWKARVPRDTGAGWDFEDVRDHYLGQLYGVDPARLRSFDLPRYLRLSRMASGEMMTQALSEWRSGHSRNSGALVWFYKDLWPAAGWGVIDSHGRPKAAYYALKRSWRSRQLTITDEGLNGLDIHLHNETAQAVSGTLGVLLLREPNIVVARREIPLCVEPCQREVRSADEILGRFCDVTYAYRFGPPQHDVAIATWSDDRGEILGEAFYFVQRHAQAVSSHVAVDAIWEPAAGDEVEVTLRAEGFLHGVSLTAEGYLPDDNYFHLAPQRDKRVRFRPLSPCASPFRAELESLNLASSISIARRDGQELQGGRRVH